jgi:hypothetical protein
MSDGTRIVLADPEGHLLEEIANPAMKRLDVAKTYRLVLASGDQARVNWRTVNTAIVDRWSASALEWIKNWAWKNSEAEIVIGVGDE